MASMNLSSDRSIEDYSVPFIVAELNTSHNGETTSLEKMIIAASEAGCDCIKLQSWSPDSLYAENFFQANPIARRMLSKFALTDEQVRVAVQLCQELDIYFSSTPYSEDEVDFLLECGAPFIKIASMDLVNDRLLKYVGGTNHPIVLSTGMGSIDEIEGAVELLEKTGSSSVCLLHCVSLYPTPPEAVRLLNILGLREKFPSHPIGFSDHSDGIELATAATGMGAALIEKHFTLDKSKIGMDNQMAIEPTEMRSLVEACHKVALSLGGTARVLSKEELDQSLKMRRSLVYARDMRRGEILTEKDTTAKRPGTDIPMARISELIGRTLSRNVERNLLIREDDFQ